MPTRQTLHDLIDAMPEAGLPEAAAALAEMVAFYGYTPAPSPPPTPPAVVTGRVVGRYTRPVPETADE